MTKLMSKSELIQKIAEQHPNNMTRKGDRRTAGLTSTVVFRARHDGLAQSLRCRDGQRTALCCASPQWPV
jgi:hypothetical protein